MLSEGGKAACLSLLKKLRAKPEAEPFLEPFDWLEFEMTDYPLVIKKPMDIGTIEVRGVEFDRCFLLCLQCGAAQS